MCQSFSQHKFIPKIYNAHLGLKKKKISIPTAVHTF
jgi:hypothetical protein